MSDLRTGVFLPKNKLTNDDLSKFLDTSDEWIFSRTGVKSRYIANSENTSDLCTGAANDIINRENINVLEIDLIIVATMTPDYFTPSTACVVQGKIGAINAFAFDISAACSGFVYALSTADKFIKSGLYKNALVIGGETVSKILDWEDRATCVLFGDGAGAMYLTNDGIKVISEKIMSDGEKGGALTANYFPVNESVSNGNSKPKPIDYLKMDGRKIFDFVIKKMPINIQETLDKANLTIDDIKYIVPHQANIRIIEALAKKLKTNIDKFYTNMEEYGNTSAASIPIALNEMEQKGMLKSGDLIMLSGFGGGLTWGSIIIKWN